MDSYHSVAAATWAACRVFLQLIRSYELDLNLAATKLEHAFRYTNLEGLMGIVQKHDLWLTNSGYCNDDEEMRLGRRIAKEVI